MDNNDSLPSRWVVFDTETTGTLPTKDRIVSFGAIGIQNMKIIPEDSFECVVRIPYNSSSVVVHGITKEQSEREGIAEEEAIRLFSDYVGEACLVGHHVDFDVIIVNHARARCGLPIMKNGSLDIMKLVIALEEAQVIQPRSDPNNFKLDGLLEQYGIGKSGRHTAIGDSFLTALIFLRLLNISHKKHPKLLEKTIAWDIGLGRVY
jgi:DNA polymerase III subunit epsilon